MSDAEWYVFQKTQRIGPFDLSQLKQMISSKMIADDAYLFKVGWKDWRPMEDCGSELDMTFAPVGDDESRRGRAPRGSIQGRVVVHNSGELIIGAGVNISASGIFVETKEQLFEAGAVLKLSVKADGLPKAFNAKAKVVRFNADPHHSVGYGMRFLEMPKQIADQIQALVDKLNAA